MHTLIFTGKDDYRDNMEIIVSQAAEHYDRACYVSFNDPYHIIVEMLQNLNAHEKFIVIDASGNAKEIQNPNKTTYILPINDLFDVYLFLRNLIIQESVKMLLIDSISALIIKHEYLPLKEMLTDLLLEVGKLRCESRLIVFKEHANHEVISHLNPLIGNNIFL